jgi:hypothetical protein
MSSNLTVSNISVLQQEILSKKRGQIAAKRIRKVQREALHEGI